MEPDRNPPRREAVYVCVCVCVAVVLFNLQANLYQVLLYSGFCCAVHTHLVCLAQRPSRVLIKARRNNLIGV